jgi:hypothetical protein
MLNLHRVNNMIEKIISFKKRLEEIKTENENIDKATVCKILVMANMAEMVIRANTKIREAEKHYFEGGAYVGRYFGDWNYHDVARDYYEISAYIQKFNW